MEWCQLYRVIFHNNTQQGNEVFLKSYIFIRPNLPLAIKMLVNKTQIYLQIYFVKFSGQIIASFSTVASLLHVISFCMPYLLKM